MFPPPRCASGSNREKASTGLCPRAWRNTFSGRLFIADYFIICSAQSQPQLRAIGDAIEERLDRDGVRLAHREGKSSAEWELLDFGYIVVHLFSEQARQFYDLERLWQHGERVDIPALQAPAERRGEFEGDAAQA